MELFNPTYVKCAFFSFLPFSFFAFHVGCGGGNENLPPPPSAPPLLETAATTPEPVANTKKEEPAVQAPALPEPELVVGQASSDPPQLPIVKFISPTSGQILPEDKGKDLAIKLDVKNWKTATGDAHVHLIFDNKPYKAIYDMKAAIKLGDLTGDAPLSEGPHTLVAFPGRANHESVKTKGALAIVNFYVKKKTTGPEVQKHLIEKQPVLIYSRPKGEYVGEMANHILVDFQLVNAELGEGKYYVDVIVDSPTLSKPLTAKVSSFGPPLFLNNLRTGTYTLHLELMDKSGKNVQHAWNSTTREISVNRETKPNTSTSISHSH